MPLRDGRSTGEKMKVSALAAGPVASGDPPAPPARSRPAPRSGRRSLRGVLGGCAPLGRNSPDGGLCDLGGTAGLSVPPPACGVRGQGLYYSQAVPARPSPASAGRLPHRGCCQQRLSAKGSGGPWGGWGGLHNDLHPSIRLWHLGGSGS